MRKLFPGYYEPTPDEIKRAWAEGIFSFDTNMLLNIYRYSDHSRKTFFRVLEMLRGRIMITHQAALEFHRNRRVAIENREGRIKELRDLIIDLDQRAKNGKKKHESRRAFYDVDIANIFDPVIESLREAKTKASQIKNSVKVNPSKESDDIQDELFKHIKEHIGKPFPKMESVYGRAIKRHSLKIPPGYEDSSKKDFTEYGDTIIWFQLLDFARSNDKPLIFVTDDAKPDWWDKSENRPRPFPELVNEMRSVSKNTFLMYNGEQFFATAQKEMPDAQIDKKVIEEAENVRLEQEEVQPSEVRITDGYWSSRGAMNPLTTDYNLIGDNFSMSGGSGRYGHVEAAFKMRYKVGESVSPRGRFFDLEHFGGGTIHVNGVSYHYIYKIYYAPAFLLIGELDFDGELAQISPDETGDEIVLSTPITLRGHLKGRQPDNALAFKLNLQGEGRAEISLKKIVDPNAPASIYEYHSTIYRINS